MIYGNKVAYSRTGRVLIEYTGAWVIYILKRYCADFGQDCGIRFVPAQTSALFF
jgi:hypothetical protein